MNGVVKVLSNVPFEQTQRAVSTFDLVRILFTFLSPDFFLSTGFFSASRGGPVTACRPLPPDGRLARGSCPLWEVPSGGGSTGGTFTAAGGLATIISTAGGLATVISTTGGLRGDSATSLNGSRMAFCGSSMVMSFMLDLLMSPSSMERPGCRDAFPCDVVVLRG